ncbi:MAG: class I SAM-dependent methyltransferase [Pseudomonadota bacterium]
MSAFFTLHRDLPREGPGDRAGLDWALGIAKPPKNAQILDAACGPGADIEGLLAHAPEGHLTAVDRQTHFIEAVNGIYGRDPRVTAKIGDISEPGGAYDLIWCAGALYFLGVENGLRLWRNILKPGGTVAFSEPIYFTDTPSENAKRFWEGYDTQTHAGITAQIEAAGYTTLGYQPVSDEAWENYYTPADARIKALRPTADQELRAVLDQAEREAAFWRANRRETGYGLFVVRPA